VRAIPDRKPLPDIVDAATRSRMMSGIRSKNTKPERIIRSGLHRLGFRFRLHPGNVPGKPDLVLPKYRAAIFVNGCFWHGHDCQLFKWPSTRRQFWRAKINRNRDVDRRTSTALHAGGWRQAVIWECALKGRERVPIEEVMRECASWILSSRRQLEIRGRGNGNS
jgi:DNA mismatch endonuclease (patch repair protein)